MQKGSTIGDFYIQLDPFAFFAAELYLDLILVYPGGARGASFSALTYIRALYALLGTRQLREINDGSARWNLIWLAGCGPQSV